MDSSGNPTGPAFPIVDDHVLHGSFYGVYLQDEWKIVPKLTLNFGARFDVFNSSFDDENQLSPRVNLIYQPTDTTTLHAGYARYFTPPPVENVPGSTVAKFNGTSNASGGDARTIPSKPSARIISTPASARNYCPDCKWAWTAITSTPRTSSTTDCSGRRSSSRRSTTPEGRVYGVEFTTSYITNGLSMYANVAVSKAQGKDWNSAQFLFDPTDAAYVKNHWIYLDHDQTVSGSFGAVVPLERSSRQHARVCGCALRQRVCRTDATRRSAQTIPNGGTVPSYYSVNVGVEQSFKISGQTDG